jgi:hypothetical protein
MARTGETEWPSNCLFHYTDKVNVEEIAEDGYFRVGTGAQFGFGLYATDLPPEEASLEEIRAVCFEGDAADNIFDGLIVLLQDDPSYPFVEVDRRVFLLPAEEGAGELIPLQQILIATGTRLRSGRWKPVPWF